MPAAASNAGPTSRRPHDSDFYQQRLKAWQPILTPKWVILTFAVIGAAFIVIGVVLKAASDGVVEFSLQYDGPVPADPASAAGVAYTACHIVNGTAPRACTLNLHITQAMKQPVYVYYELDNFYQNHRRYVKSRSDPQLSGTVTASTGSLQDCLPLITGTFNDTSKVLDPCGLIANSYFNDTISLSNANITMAENDISWPSDRNTKFKAPSAAAEAEYADRVAFIQDIYPDVADVTDEHFIVWMRTAALPNFRKLYGRITQDIPADTILSFDIQANYPVSGFSGKKSLVVSTTSFLGGKNPFLGIAYMVVGALCCFLAILFGVRQLFGGRRLGDTAYLVWNSKK